MPRGYILFNVESGSEDDVLRQLRSLSNVQESFVSYGVYDLIVRIKADTMEELKNVISHKIRTISHVRSTLTLIIMEE